MTKLRIGSDPMVNRRGEVWELNPYTTLLVLRQGDRVTSLLCLNLLTGEVEPWPRHTLSTDYGATRLA